MFCKLFNIELCIKIIQQFRSATTITRPLISFFRNCGNNLIIVVVADVNVIWCYMVSIYKTVKFFIICNFLWENQSTIQAVSKIFDDIVMGLDSAHRSGALGPK